ncbi:MAG: hypothetical protein R3E12_15535, partial [Candidatus Eisenbacteria bacterium]
SESLCFGVYIGDDTVCEPNPCPDFGACCFSSGHCVVTTQSSCVNNGGAYDGTDTSCDPSPCTAAPTGACCFTAGSCFIMQQADCDLAAATYKGDASVCDPNPCTPGGSTGACCDASGCSITTQAACEDGGGFFLGAGLTCTANPCDQPDDLLGIWDITTEAKLCDTDSTIFAIALTDTFCVVDDPYDPGSDPQDTICKYEIDGGVLVSTCQSTFEFGGCSTTTTSVFRITFGNGSYSGTGVARSVSTGTCNTQTCFELSLSGTRTGPAPDPCPTSGREDQMKGIAAGIEGLVLEQQKRLNQ